MTWERVLQAASIAGLLAALVFLWLWRLDAMIVAAVLGSAAWFVRLRRELSAMLAQEEDSSEAENEN